MFKDLGRSLMLSAVLLGLFVAPVSFQDAPFQLAEAEALTIPYVEYGSWTPSVGGTATYAEQTGTWVKIGKSVTVFCRLRMSSLGTGSTTIISGLYHPIDLTPVIYSIVPVYFTGLSQSVSTVIGQVGPGGVSTVTLYSLLTDGVSMTNNAVIGDSTIIYFTATYLTD